MDSLKFINITMYDMCCIENEVVRKYHRFAGKRIYQQEEDDEFGNEKLSSVSVRIEDTGVR